MRRPGNAKSGAVIPETRYGPGRLSFTDEAAHDRPLLQVDVFAGKAPQHMEASTLNGAQNPDLAAQKRPRLLPSVHDDIENPARRAGQGFRYPMKRLLVVGSGSPAWSHSTDWQDSRSIPPQKFQTRKKTASDLTRKASPRETIGTLVLSLTPPLPADCHPLWMRTLFHPSLQNSTR